MHVHKYIRSCIILLYFMAELSIKGLIDTCFATFTDFVFHFLGSVGCAVEQAAANIPTLKCERNFPGITPHHERSRWRHFLPRVHFAGPLWLQEQNAGLRQNENYPSSSFKGFMKKLREKQSKTRKTSIERNLPEFTSSDFAFCTSFGIPQVQNFRQNSEKVIKYAE